MFFKHYDLNMFSVSHQLNTVVGLIERKCLTLRPPGQTIVVFRQINLVAIDTKIANTHLKTICSKEKRKTFRMTMLKSA